MITKNRQNKKILSKKEKSRFNSLERQHELMKSDLQKAAVVFDKLLTIKE